MPSFVNPFLLWGGLAIASPIIIHLLSKRKFKIIDWAAMDFLLDAEKRNRRRVKMENLILLLLRCLACLLIAMLVARPFSKVAGLGILGAGAPFERIILFDDSPSMQLLADGKTTFDQTKESLVDFIRELGRERSRDSITLRLTSRPDQPLAAGEFMTEENVERIVQEVEQLEASDLPARFESALQTIEQKLADAQGTTNHVLYIVTDMRHRDWYPARDMKDAASETIEEASTPADTNGPSSDEAAVDKRDATAILKRLSKVEGMAEIVLVDVGSDATENLIVTDVRVKNKALVRDVDADFEVVVFNAGANPAENVEVVFRAGDAVELKSRVQSIPAGEEAVVPFTFRFEETGSVPVTVSIDADALRPDNSRHFAARVTDGVQVLLVNGDPSSDPERSETFFLKLALTPGDARTGYAIEEVSETVFETMPLDKYQVIFICNLYRVTEDRLAGLEKWVDNGGGLVFFLGDQVDEQVYNQILYKDGEGLLPAMVMDMRGDESENKWQGMIIDDSNHLVLRDFADVLKPLISAVKVFRWWHVVIDKKALDSGKVAAPMRLNDVDNSAMFVEQNFGDGRVVLVATTVDGEWNDWPNYHSYVPIMLDTASYMARDMVGDGTRDVGTTVVHELDPARYNQSARMLRKREGGEPDEPEGVDVGEDEEGKTWIATYEGMVKAGFYELQLTRKDDQLESVLFAANIDPTEGRLQRVNEDDFTKKLGDANVKMVKGKATLAVASDGLRNESWREILYVLVGILCLEQFLGWKFGKSRM